MKKVLIFCITMSAVCPLRLLYREGICNGFETDLKRDYNIVTKPPTPNTQHPSPNIHHPKYRLQNYKDIFIVPKTHAKKVFIMG